MKTFLSYTEQIHHLQHEKNLIIDDITYATKTLQHIGYFSLINGYKQSFKNPTTKQYRDGTRLEDIVLLYMFDKQIRTLFLTYILQIEQHLRSLLSHTFVAKYGCEQMQYLTPNHYIMKSSTQQGVNRLIKILESNVTQKSSYPYIEHQRQQYGNVPLWVLVNSFTFGTLSKFYTYMPSDLQSQISKHFDAVNERQLGQFLNVITKFRNVCAHNERLFQYRTIQEIPNMPIHHNLHIEQKGTQYLCGKKDLFALVVAFRYLLPNEDFLKFKRTLMRTMKQYLQHTGSISEHELLHAMGFPTNWTKISTVSKQTTL